MSDPPAKSVLFARGVIARLAIWSALRIAIEQGWGGPEGIEKRRWLASVVVDAFETQHPAPDGIYVEEILLQVMEDEFETTLEDSSAEVVGNDIVCLWDQLHQGVDNLVLKFEELADELKGKKTNVQLRIASDEETEDGEGDDDSGDDEDMDDEEVPALGHEGHETAQRRDEPEVDGDGFTLVKNKSKSRR